MAGPPSKKRKTLIEFSDDSSSPPESTSDGHGVAAPSKAQPSRATRRSSGAASGSRAAAKPKVVIAPPKRPQPPIKPKKLTGKYKSLHSFFGVPQGSAFPPSAVLNAQTPMPLQNEDADDMIEDVSDEDEDVMTRRRTARKDSSLQSHLIVSKPSVTRGIGGLLATKVPRLSRVRTTAEVVRRPEGAATSLVGHWASLNTPTNTRTWSEKYAPQTVEGLALNKMKVREVQMWLENVLGRLSRQRVLVLKGSAGTGKTATVNALAKEMGIEILEWRNPQGAAEGVEYGEEGAFAAGLSGMFEEFVGRAGKFGSLDLVSATGKESPGPSSQNTTDDGKKKLIVIEDFPNTLFTSSSAPLQSFRHTIKSFLAIPAPPPGALPLSPLILIITETTSISGPTSFTAHRLLSPEILHHPLVKEIGFNKIAPTYMYRALNSIVMLESRDSDRKFGPSKAVLDALSTSGDIRSAIMGLEFLAMNGDLPGSGFIESIAAQRKLKKKPEDRRLTLEEQRMVEAVTQRESAYGIFHAVGKVLYNKRYGDDPEDEYCPPPPRPPLDTLPYHSRRVRMDLETLIDDTGTDPQTFISGLHENYLGSCNPEGVARQPASDEDILDTVNLCLDYLSDSDLLASKGFGYDSPGSGDTAGIRADELSFQTAVRGVMMSLPSPVKRFLGPKGGANKMFYPTSARLWRSRQEVADVVEWFVGNQRQRNLYKGGMKEALEERMPYISLIERRMEWIKRRQGAFAKSQGQSMVDMLTKMALEKATVFKGVGKQSEDPADENEGEDTAVEKKHGQGQWKKTVIWAEEIGVGDVVEKLVLSDDDIEEF